MKIKTWWLINFQLNNTAMHMHMHCLVAKTVGHLRAAVTVVSSNVLIWQSARTEALWLASNSFKTILQMLPYSSFFGHTVQKQASGSQNLWHQVLNSLPSPSFSSIHAQRHLFLAPLSVRTVSLQGLINFASKWAELQGYHAALGKICPSLPLIS